MIAVFSIILSTIAVAFSIFVFMEGRRRYKRDVFLKIHELMISEDQYRGRQLLLSHTFDGRLSFPAGILNFESSCGVCDG